MADVWTREEVELIVQDYLAMFLAELRGERVNKAAHRKALLPRLNGRTGPSVEFKHRNISAALMDNDFAHLRGYVPAVNYQHMVEEVVLERLASLPELVTLMEAASEMPPRDSDVRRSLHEVPLPARKPRAVPLMNRPRPPRVPVQVNYLEREASNRSLGAAGEELVVRHETQRLHAAGARRLADRVEHSSRARGDGLGYDVLSFEVDGTPRYIEVKTTRLSRFTPFYFTANEARASRELQNTWWLYRVFDFAEKPGLFTWRGRLDGAFVLDATVWRASVP